MILSQPKGPLFIRTTLKKATKPIASFFRRLKKGVSLMSKGEKLLSLILISVALILGIIKVSQYYVTHTVAVPAFGGTYKEALEGEVKYLNPILAKTDAEKSISNLIYDGLVKVDKEGNISPSLAKEWQIGSDGLQYIFTLRDGVTFHNGQIFDAGDVVATINLIQDPSIKSAHYDIWKDVKVATPDPSTVEFDLPRSYGPFIFQCTQGIMSKDDINSSLVSNFNGTGRYKFISSSSVYDGYVKRISLSANRNHFDLPSHIESMTFDVFSPGQSSLVNQNISNYSAEAGFAADQGKFVIYNFETNRQLALIANTRQPQMADAATRKRVMQFTPGDPKLSIKLLALDAKAQKDEVDELNERAKAANIEIMTDFASSVDFQEKLLKRDYDIVLYGFDFGYDRDPYVYWHGSQLNAMNIAGLSDKTLDILLEDARMIADPVERNAKYDQFFESVKARDLIVFFPFSKYNYAVKSEVKGIDSIIASKPQDRFAGEANWFMIESRVKK